MKFNAFMHLSFILIGCVSENDNLGANVSSTLSECQNAQLSKLTGGDVGKVFHASKDSLQFEIGVTLVCQGRFDETADFPNDSTLRITYKYEDSSTGCVCKKKATIAVTSSEHDLNTIKQADFNGRVYRLEMNTI